MDIGLGMLGWRLEVSCQAGEGEAEVFLSQGANNDFPVPPGPRKQLKGYDDDTEDN